MMKVGTWIPVDDYEAISEVKREDETVSNWIRRQIRNGLSGNGLPINSPRTAYTNTVPMPHGTNSQEAQVQ